jgi:hypothetical protein
MDQGFQLRDGEVQRFGRGIYLTPDRNEALGFGRDIIEVEVVACDIHDIQYEIIAREYDLDYEEQEGYPKLEQYAKDCKHKAVSVLYSESDIEIVVYDLEIIKIVA